MENHPNQGLDIDINKIIRIPYFGNFFEEVASENWVLNETSGGSETLSQGDYVEICTQEVRIDFRGSLRGKC